MKKLLIVLLIVAAVVAVPLLRNPNFGDEREVDVEAVAARTIRSSILASGNLSHEEEVMLSTEVIGKVTALHVEEGDKVQAGQLLLQIDDEAPAAMVEQQLASTRMQEIAIESQRLRVENLQKQWERQQQLFERRLLDQDSFELATNELELARLDLRSREASLRQGKALLEEAEKNLRRTRVFAPLSGIVTSLDIKVGETAIASTTNVPGSSLMTIANPASIHTEVDVDEADIAGIALGQEAEVVAIAYPNQPMKARVEAIAVSAKQPEGSQSLSFVVKLVFTDTNGVVLRPGMSCRAEIFTSSGEAVPALPIQAIVMNEDQSANRIDYTVFRFDAGVARATAVQVGVSDDSHQEIVEGLALGDQVIVGPDRILRNLEDGDRVRLREEGANAAD